MPVFTIVFKQGEVLFADYFSTIFFKKHYLELANVVKEKFNVEFPELERVLSGDVLGDPSKLLHEAQSFLELVYDRGSELPRAYFFAVLPRDFSDVVSLLLGGASTITIPTEEGVYKLVSGFGYASLIKDGSVVKNLSEGDVVEVGNVRVKVYSKHCYKSVDKPLKTLIYASLLAIRKKAYVKLTEKTPLSLVFVWG